MSMQQKMLTTDVSTLLPTVLEPLVFSSSGGERYRIASSLIRADPATRFFAIARGDEALIGDIFVLEPEVPFVAYIDRLAAWHDLELLWAGWRIFLFLCGRPDQEPSEDLPRWRSDWYAPLTALPIATYQFVDGDRTRIATIYRASPAAFTATIVDTQGRRCGVVTPCPSVVAVLDCAQLGLVSDTAAVTL